MNHPSATFSKPQLASLLQPLRIMRDDAITTCFRDGMDSLILLVSELVTTHGDEAVVKLTEE